MARQKPNSLTFLLLPILLGIFIAGLIIEAFFFFLLTHPQAAGKHPVLLGYTAYLHESFRKKHIQYSPDCAKYDPDLFYTLKPGQCDITEPEFQHVYYINSQGLRDDEISLQAPEIIFLGDSFTMGWGVSQDQTFAQIVERKTGLRTLNTGIASYGTVREFKMLSRINTSRLRYLILQHCLNDCEENLEFFQTGKLEISPQSDYLALVEERQTLKKYFPGKYGLSAFHAFWIQPKRLQLFKKILYKAGLRNYWIEPEEFVSSAAEQLEEEKSCAALLIHTLTRFASQLPSNVQLLILDTELRHGPTARVMSDLKIRLQNSSLPAVLRNAHVVYTHPHLNPKQHYYILDDHLNQAGHEVIASLILKSLFPTKEERK